MYKEAAVVFNNNNNHNGSNCEKNNDDNNTDSSVENTPQCNRWPPGGFAPGDRSKGWMAGIFGCMQPVISLIGRTNLMETTRRPGDDWEIPFEIITDLEWVGSGAQGAVFSGKLRGVPVAVKKVRDVRETDIKHLRKLDHDHIVKFK